jgi:hypothetical protein
MYREPKLFKLLDTIFNSKAVALLLKITRSDGKGLMSYWNLMFNYKTNDNII